MNSQRIQFALRDVLVLLIVKLAFILLLWDVIHSAADLNPHQNGLSQWWGYKWGDTAGYFGPAENLIQNGSYSPDYRMPGYGTVYMIIRLVFPMDITLRLIIILQLFVSVLACYALGKTALYITNSKAVGILVAVLCCISLKNVRWDFVFLTESFTTSALALSFFFIIRHIVVSGHRVDVFISGMLLTWAIFMRPVYAPLVLLFALVLLLRKGAAIGKVRFVIIFLVPFFLTEALWVSRNYAHYHRFIPLIKQKYDDNFHKYYMASLIDFMMAQGSSILMFDQKGELAWYIPPGNSYVGEAGANYQPKPPPAYLRTTQFNLDSLKHVRELIYQFESTPGEKEKRDINSEIVSRLDRYTASIRNDLPFLYYVKSRFMAIRRHLVTSSTDFLPPLRFSEMKTGQQIIKVLYSLFYLWTMLLGFLSIVVVFIHNSRWLFLPLGVSYCVMISPLLGLAETRYLAPAFPLMIVCAAYSTWSIYTYVMSRLKTSQTVHPS